MKQKPSRASLSGEDRRPHIFRFALRISRLIGTKNVRNAADSGAGRYG
jgi:hypothetical protein